MNSEEGKVNRSAETRHVRVIIEIRVGWIPGEETMPVLHVPKKVKIQFFRKMAFEIVEIMCRDRDNE